MTLEDQNHEDRRSFERFTSRFPARYQDTRNDYGTNVSLRNASAQGVQITTKERLYIGDNIALEVELPDGKYPMVLRGSVVWVRNAEPDVWDVGLKFHRIDLVHMSRLYKYAVPALYAV